jgi:hypothetical protein
MEEIIRPLTLPARSQGYKSPSTRGQNADDPLLALEGGAAQTDRTVYARTDEPEDFARNPHTGVLVTGLHEICSAWVSVSGSYEINPNACGVWRLRAYSSSLTLTFASLDALPSAASATLWSTAVRTATIEIIIEWQSAASRTVTLSGVRWAGGTAPTWTTTAGRDVVIVQVMSDGDKYGFAAAMDSKT